MPGVGDYVQCVDYIVDDEAGADLRGIWQVKTQISFDEWRLERVWPGPLASCGEYCDTGAEWGESSLPHCQGVEHGFNRDGLKPASPLVLLAMMAD